MSHCHLPRSSRPLPASTKPNVMPSLHCAFPGSAPGSSRRQTGALNPGPAQPLGTPSVAPGVATALPHDAITKMGPYTIPKCMRSFSRVPQKHTLDSLTKGSPSIATTVRGSPACIPTAPHHQPTGVHGSQVGYRAMGWPHPGTALSASMC